MELIDKNELLEKIEELEAQNNCGTSDFIEAKRIAFNQVKESLDSIEIMTLQEGEYIIPDDCTAKFVGRTLLVYKRKDKRLAPTEYRCKDCKHRVKGYTFIRQHYDTMVCELKPKDNGLFYGAPLYGKPCDKFEKK